MAGAIAKCSDVQSFKDLLKRRHGALQKAAAGYVTADRMLNIALTMVTKTPALSRCTQESVYQALIQCAELGLEPNSVLGTAYFVPYSDTCTLIVGYRGLIELAHRSGKIKSISAHVVYQGDDFSFRYGLNETLEHEPKGDVDDKNITHAYCIIHYKDGGHFFDVMTLKEIQKVRMGSKASGNGPWVSHFAEMCRKTVVRRALKYAPMSVQIARAIEIDTAADTGDFSFIGNEVIDAETVTDVQPEPTPQPKAEKVTERLRREAESAEPEVEAEPVKCEACGERGRHRAGCPDSPEYVAPNYELEVANA